ncbi:MAG: DUF4867 family protein [Sphaerochaetaceae bacterium]|jgi:hypothetical protein|nr:DUF4867 family protein [Sphaerochaetaceae bacterium]
MQTNEILEKLRKANPLTQIHQITDPSFSEYGRVLDPSPYTALAALADRTTKALDHNVYEADVKAFHLPDAMSAATTLFGGTAVEIGYCNGQNHTMNGLEYHKSPELTIAVTDLVLFLAKQRFFQDFDSIDSSCAEAFYVPRGSAFALHPEILHLAPCCVFSSGFKAIIVLPLGTNTELYFSFKPESYDPESAILFKTNKWMIAHRDRIQLTSQGVHAGLLGENRCINPID